MTCEDAFVRGDLPVKYELNSLFGNVYLLLGFLCGSCGIIRDLRVISRRSKPWERIYDPFP